MNHRQTNKQHLSPGWLFYQVTRLSTMVKESEHGLGSASSHINSLKEAAAALKTELDKARAQLKASKTHSANLQVSHRCLVWSVLCGET